METIYTPADRDALPQTKALYQRLKSLEGHQVLFGQQDTFALGANFAPNLPENLGKSDIRTATGRYPGVAGFDIGHLEVYFVAQRDPEFARLIPGKDRTGGDFEVGMNIDNIDFSAMREEIRFAHRAGCVVTLSWHSVNPLTAGEYGKPNRTWIQSVVKAVLPGGPLHARFDRYLDAFLAYNDTLRDDDGQLIPYIFRPFHEHSGDWFWWGIDSAENPNDGTAWSGDGGRLNDPEDFAALYRYTVEYLRAHGAHNLLFCICPDRSRLPAAKTAGFDEELAQAWLRGYPGDDVIDLFGLDNYADAGRADPAVPGDVQLQRFTGALETLAVLAKEHGKLCALTEMGLASAPALEQAGLEPRRPYTDWFLRAVDATENTRRILYGLVWRPRFVGPGADPCGVYRVEPNDPADFSKGFRRTYLYSLQEDLQRFADDPRTAFVAAGPEVQT